jgi:hypothetical protein
MMDSIDVMTQKLKSIDVEEIDASRSIKEETLKLKMLLSSEIPKNQPIPYLTSPKAKFRTLGSQL